MIKFSDHPGIQLSYPTVIDLLNFCYEQQFIRIHVLAPGLTGLSGLLIARILKLPIDCTYHDTIPAYVRCFTKDESVNHIIRRYSSWFDNQIGRNCTTYAKAARKLAQEGIRSEKTKIEKPWEDAENVSNLKNEGFFKCHFRFL